MKSLVIAALMLSASMSFARDKHVFKPGLVPAPTPVTYPLTGHIEWVSSNFKADATVTVITPSGDSHTLECDTRASLCTIDSAHGVLVVVLADGTRVEYLTRGPNIKADGSYDGNDPLGVGQELFSEARRVSGNKNPEWPTFSYRNGRPSVCTDVHCETWDKALYLPGEIEYDFMVTTK